MLPDDQGTKMEEGMQRKRSRKLYRGLLGSLVELSCASVKDKTPNGWEKTTRELYSK